MLYLRDDAYASPVYYSRRRSQLTSAEGFHVQELSPGSRHYFFVQLRDRRAAVAHAFRTSKMRRCPLV